jgi:23S rRNA-/tRNA-specific pseudouridylate synthase
MWNFVTVKTDRLDRALRAQAFPGSEWMSRQAWDHALHDGRVRVAGRVCKKGGTEVAAHTEIAVDLPTLGLAPAEEAPPLVWAAPDGSLAVFNKAAGVDTYPLFPWERGTLANAVARYAQSRAGLAPGAFAALSMPPILEGGLLQRLDRDTSGIVCSAFTKEAKAAYRRVFSGAAEKGYLALVGGVPQTDDGSYEVYYGGGEQARVRAELAPKPNLTPATLRVRTLARGEAASLLAVETSQGLRHVVRAGMAALGHPLVGDLLYGGSSAASFHQLHAAWLRLPGLPEFRVPPPESFLSTARRLGLEYSP